MGAAVGAAVVSHGNGVSTFAVPFSASAAAAAALPVQELVTARHHQLEALALCQRFLAAAEALQLLHPREQAQQRAELIPALAAWREDLARQDPPRLAQEQLRRVQKIFDKYLLPNV